MEINERLKIGIGNLESEKLKPKKVKVVSVRIEKPMDREGNVIKGHGGKELTEKVVLVAKHPDKDETIELSRLKS